MKYFFVLGTNPTLSVAELAAVLGLKNARLLADDFLLWETDLNINLERLMSLLGGTIKIGLARKELSWLSEEKLEPIIYDLISAKRAVFSEGKFSFGFSDYGKHHFKKNPLGLNLKKRLQKEGISARFVTSREKTLSSVVVEQNRLLKRGAEFVLVKDGDQVLIGETLAVQPFKDLSRRDYGRPARDDKSGMLPPKLAQIMINLAQVEDMEAPIVDPFCGSGTILSEAMLAGYKNLFGSDISPKAIDDTYKNISWIKELYKLEGVKTKVVVKNVINLSKFIKAGYAEAVITEPFLGPQRGQINFQSVIADLENLYTEAIRQFRIILKSGGRVVMVWPLFYGQKPIKPNYDGLKIIDMIPDNLSNSEFIKKNQRPTIIYGRSGQKVYREIVVLEKE